VGHYSSIIASQGYWTASDSRPLEDPEKISFIFEKTTRSATDSAQLHSCLIAPEIPGIVLYSIRTIYLHSIQFSLG
jgi:hypothetical protein